MAWNFGNYYRFKTCAGQFVVRTIETGTLVVEVMCEVSAGDNKGQRLKFTGFLGSPKGAQQGKENAARAVKDLRAMGWKGQTFRDASGIGSGYEFEARVMGDAAQDGSGKMFARMAFPREVSRVSFDRALSPQELERLDEAMPIEQLENIAEAQEHDRKNERRNGQRRNDNIPPDFDDSDYSSSPAET